MHEKNLHPQEWDIDPEKKKELVYSPGETIFKQDAFAPHVLYIIDGLVKISLQSASQKDLNLRIAQANDFLGFSAIFGDQTYNFTAISLTQVTVCMIDKQSLQNLLLKNPEFALHITAGNYQYEKQLLKVIQNLNYKHMRGKLASAIIYLTDPRWADTSLFQYLNRQDLAGFAGISTESTIRFLKEFEKDKIIRLSGKEIFVLSQDKLIAVSNSG